jgi:hypothetical protein
MALWTAQWPALRSVFAFRTRDTVRPAPKSPYITFARRSRGMAGVVADAPPLPVWALRLLDPLDPNPNGLRAFLRRFGPEQPPLLQSMVDLAEIHGNVAEGSTAAVARVIESRYRRLNDAPRLKAGLFGERPRPWWRPSQAEMVEALLLAEQDAWDPEQLNLQLRIEELVTKGTAGRLAAARNQSGPESLRRVLLTALIAVAKPEDAADVAAVDQELGTDLLLKRTDLAADPKTWKPISDAQVVQLLRNPRVPKAGLVTALRAGKAQSVLEVFDSETVVEALVDSGHLDILFEVSKIVNPDALAALADRRPVVAVALAAIRWPVSQSAALAGLERTRGQVDHVWLTAAVKTLAAAHSDQVGTVLQVVFGPLHHGITDDRLPPESWELLDQMLPQAHDPALRLRRLLVEVARTEKWQADALERAVRGGGPFIDELHHELDDEDPLHAAFKVVLKTLRRVTGS